MSDDFNELQREVEVSRAKLDLTLDKLEEKLTVSGVVDDMLGAVRQGPYAPTFDHVLRTLRKNPVPLLLVAAGVGLLLHRLRPKAAHVPASPRVVMDRDVPPVPLEPRLYEPGASNLQSREGLDDRRRAANIRI